VIGDPAHPGVVLLASERRTRLGLDAELGVVRVSDLPGGMGVTAVSIHSV